MPPLKPMCPMSLSIETKKYSRVSAVEVIRDKYERKAEAGNSEEKVGHGGARAEAEMGDGARGEEDTSRVGI